MEDVLVAHPFGWLATIHEKFAVTLYKTFMVSEEKDAIIHLLPIFPPEGEDDEEIDYLSSYLESYLSKITTFTPDPIYSKFK